MSKKIYTFNIEIGGLKNRLNIILAVLRNKYLVVTPKKIILSEDFVKCIKELYD